MAESDMEIKDWKRRNSVFALYESQCKLESQRHQLRQAGQWADQAQRERERERKNEFFVLQDTAKKLMNYEDAAARKKIK